MGTYLSTPIVDKGIEEGEDLSCKTSPLAWGVVDMQGWRKSMEDAHIAQTDVSQPSTHKGNSSFVKVFAVFDGHGGSEVARFCQLYLVDVLTREQAWCGKNVDVGKALADTFHSLDQLIDSPSRRDEINNLRGDKPAMGERRTLDAPIVTKSQQENNEQFEDEKKSEETSNPSKDEDDSQEIVGQIGDDRLDTDEDNNTNEKGGGETVSLFKKLLSISKGNQASVNVVTQDDITTPQNDTAEDGDSTPTVITPTKILNGRQVCNLPDHPIHAGCTAVCAVIVGNILTVANAGDSRVVLCRGGGLTEAMSYDHKPLHDIEMKRITNAGGFVNQFGRVNGNLNLSRSIGDMKYKQVPNIALPDQMITAQPDLKSVELNDDDEFIILACDGIWDCLTNEEAVKYVHDRIDSKTPIEIGTELLDAIISTDPRVTQGIGGDNMTVMVVDLKPATRSFRN